MLGQQGPVTENTDPQTGGGLAVFEVTGVNQFLLGQAGLLGLYYSGAAAPAGYAFDTNAVLDQALDVNAQLPAIQPAYLQGQRYQLMQARFKSKFLNAPAPPVARDLDTWALNPTRVWAGTANGMNGVLNVSDQYPDPIDIVALTAQGTNPNYPTLYPAGNLAEWETQWYTELWWYYNQQPSFTLSNNGSANIAAGGTFGWFLKVLITVYNVTPVGSARMRTENLGGTTFPVPAAISRTELMDGLVQTQQRIPGGTPILVG